MRVYQFRRSTMGFAMDDISWTDLSPAEQRVIAVLGAGISTALFDAIALQSLRRAGLIKGSRLTPKAEQLRKAVILTLAKPIRAAGASSARRWSKDWTSPAASWGRHRHTHRRTQFRGVRPVASRPHRDPSSTPHPGLSPPPAPPRFWSPGKSGTARSPTSRAARPGRTG